MFHAWNWFTTIMVLGKNCWHEWCHQPILLDWSLKWDNQLVEPYDSLKALQWSGTGTRSSHLQLKQHTAAMDHRGIVQPTIRSSRWTSRFWTSQDMAFVGQFRPLHPLLFTSHSRSVTMWTIHSTINHISYYFMYSSGHKLSWVACIFKMPINLLSPFLAWFILTQARELAPALGCSGTRLGILLHGFHNHLRICT